MNFCPNVNSEIFQELLKYNTESTAYYLWNKYEGNVPKRYFSVNKEKLSIPENNLNQIQELFESNPELANSVYEALGFFKSIQQTQRIDNQALYSVLENNTEYGIDSLNIMLGRINDNFSLRLLNLFTYGNKNFYIDNSISEFGLYDAETDSIYINTERHIKNNPKDYNILETIMHELIHRFISFNILGRSSFNEQAKNIVDLFEDVKILYKGNNKYALSDVDEFVSEVLSNKVFQNELKKIPYKNSNIFNKFIDYLLSALNIKRDNLLSEAIIRIIEFKSLDNITLFNKFNNNAEIISSQQKQQAQQLYSQYLEQNPNGSVEGFKNYINNQPKFLTEANVNNDVNKNFITYEEALEKARKLLPGFSEKDLQFLSKEAFYNQAGRTDVLGMYRKGSVFILDKQGKGTVEEYILRHEIFHKIFTEYLTKKEQNDLFENYKKQFGVDNIGEFEEELALKFQHWVNGKSKPTGKLLQFFKDILRFLGLIKANTKSLESFFEQIENGYFNVKKQDSNFTSKFISDIQLKFKSSKTLVDNTPSDSVQNYNYLNSLFLKEFNAYSEEGVYLNLQGNIKTKISSVKRELDKDPKNEKLKEVLKDLENQAVSYIVTNHAEIQSKIIKKLAIEMEFLNRRISEIKEVLEKHPTDVSILAMLKKYESDLAFKQLYTKNYEYLYEQAFPTKASKINKRKIEHLFKDVEFEETDIDDIVEPEKGQAFSLQEESYDSTNKTSVKVKTILSNVYDIRRKKYLSYEEAYKITLTTINDLPVYDLDSWKAAVNEKVKNVFNNDSRYKAVTNKIFKIAEKANNKTYLDRRPILDENDNLVPHTEVKSFPTNAKFLNLDSKEVFLFVFDENFDTKNIERIEDVTNYLKPGEYIIIDRKGEDGRYKDTQGFFVKINSELLKVAISFPSTTEEEIEKRKKFLNVVKEFRDNYQLFSSLRIKEYNTQLFRELIQNITSQKENNRLLGTQVTNDQGTEYRYFSAIKPSIEGSVKSDIRDKLENIFTNKDSVIDFAEKHKDVFFKKYNNEHKALTSAKDQLLAVKYILNELGFGNYDYASIEDFPIENLYNSFKYLLFTKDTGFYNLITDVEDTQGSTVKDILDKEGTFMNRLANFLMHQMEKDRPGMSKKADGKMVYNYTPSSNGMDIYRRLSQSNYLMGSKKLPYEPGFEYLQTDYFKFNPFNPFNEKGKLKNTLHETFIHDGISISSSFGKSKSIEVYTKEDLSKFINRTFNMGFLTTLVKDSNTLKYIQFSSPVSNRPNIPGLEINLLSNDQIKNGIITILEQIVARPDHKNIRNYDKRKLVNLDKIGQAIREYSAANPNNKNLVVEVKNEDNEVVDYLYNLTPELIKNEKFIKSIVDSFNKQVTEDAEVLFKQFLENEVTFSSNIFENNLVRAYNILQNSKYNFFEGKNVEGYKEKIKNALKNNRHFETWKEVEERFLRENPNIKEVNREVLKENGYVRQYKINSSLKEAFIPLLNVYLKNDYINSYFLDQLNMGGAEFFKGSVDRVKRRQGAYSPGLKGLVNEALGMSNYFYTAVIEDPTRKLSKDIKNTIAGSGENYLLDLLYNTGIITDKMDKAEQSAIYNNFVKKFDKFNPTDAQGYMLPERAAELQKGFGESYDIGNVLKPAHYEIDAQGIPRMVKYSAIVLTDDLVKNFPQLGHLRNKMRNAKDAEGNSRPIGEIVYNSAFKVGAHINQVGTKDGKFSEENFLKLFEESDYEISPEAVVKLNNERYKLQLNPEHDLEEGHVAKPTQLMYFLNILGSNKNEAFKVYETMSKIMDIELKNFKEKYLNDDDTFVPETFIKYLVSKGAASKTEVYHEILAELYNDVYLNKLKKEPEEVRKFKTPRPWNFPGIEDKIITQFSASLQNNVVQTKFKGTKLVLMSQVGASLENQPRLQYKTDPNGNLYAEAYLPKKFLNDSLEKEIQEKGFADLFYLPELLGFRIPSSEIHSAVPMRVVGFHDLGSNVVILPEELVPLHGSDFDVDALFVISPEVYGTSNKNKKLFIGEDYKKLPIGYVKDEDGKYHIQDEESFIKFLESRKLEKDVKDEILKAYYKNVVSNIIIQVTADKKNRERMISPISMIELGESIKKLFAHNPSLNSSGKIDESSAIDKQKVHSSSMNGRDGTGIFANFAKGMAYVLNASSDTKNPLLLKQEENLPFFTSTLPLNTIIDKVNFWENLDSLLNAAIDNVKEQALPKLNLNGTTIPTYSMMLGLGVDFHTANLIMVQPVIKHISSIFGKEGSQSKGTLSAITFFNQKVKDILKTNKELSVEEINFLSAFLADSLSDSNIILTEQELLDAVSKEKITSSNFTISDIKDVKDIITQIKVLKNYQRTENIVSSVNKLVRYLSIVRDMPVFSNDIDELIELRNSIWDPFGNTLENFPLNVDLFFEANPHIKKSDEVLLLQKSILEKNFFKHHPMFESFFENLKVLNFDVNKHDDKKLKQDEFVKFIYSSLYFTKEHNEVLPFVYTLKGFKYKKELYDQEAFVQHFVNKVKILKDIIPNNSFIKRFATSGLGYSEDIKKLSFFLDSKITPLDKADYEKAFGELMNYNIYPISKEEYDSLQNDKVKKKYGSNYYRIVYRDLKTELENGKSKESDLQKEFVQYNILTEGMRNSSSSYSQLLPGYIYREQYYAYENVMKSLITPGRFSEKSLTNLQEAFWLNIVFNNSDKMLDFSGEFETKTSDNYSLKTKQGSIFFDLIVPQGKRSDEYIKVKHPKWKQKYSSQEDFEASFEDVINQQIEEENFTPTPPDYYVTKLYKKVYTSSVDNNVYYQEVGTIKNNKIYKSNSEVLNPDGSNTYDRFSGKYYHLHYSELKGNKIVLAKDEKTYFFKENNLIKNGVVEYSISSAKDPLRLNTKFIRITNYNSETNEVTFEELPTKPEIKETYSTVYTENANVTFKGENVSGAKVQFFSEVTPLKEVLKQSKSFLTPLHYALFEHLEPFVKLEDTVVDFNASLRGKTLGKWIRKDGFSTIQVNKNIKDFKTASATFLHELLHHVVYDLLHKNENLLSDSQRDAKRRLESLYKIALKEAKKDKQKFYGLTNLDEFINEAFVDEPFQKWLSSKIINKKSLWTRFTEAIAKLLNIPQDTLLFDVVNSTFALLDGHSLEDPSVKNADLQDVEMDKKRSISDLKGNFVEIKSAAEKINLKVALNPDGTQGNKYTSNIKTFKRSTNEAEGLQTNFMVKFDPAKYKEDPITAYADDRWEKEKKKDDEEIFFPQFNRSFTKADYISFRKNHVKERQTMGKAVESLLRWYLTGEESSAEEVNTYLKELPLELQNKVLRLNDWEVIQKIVFNKMQSNLLNFDGSTIDFSLKTFSKTLDSAGEIDMMIKHPDGLYSLYDIKSSQFLSENEYTTLFKYGDTHGLNLVENQRNKAKLQIMFYALMVRLNNPSIEFKNLSIVHLPITSSKTRLYDLLDDVTISDDTVHAASFIEMITAFLKDRKTQEEKGLIKAGDLTLYEQLDAEYKSNGGSGIKDLLDPLKYHKSYNPNSNINTGSNKYSGLFVTGRSQQEQILQELSILTGSETDFYKVAHPKRKTVKINDAGDILEVESFEAFRKRRIGELIEEWVKLTGDTNLQFMSTQDIDWLHLNFASNKDMDNNPVFSTWNKFKHERQVEKRKAASEKVSKMTMLSSKILSFGPISFKSQREIFSKFIKEEHLDHLGRKVERLIVKDKDAEYNNLSEDEKAFVNYLNDTFASYFASDAYLNQIGSMYVDQFGNTQGLTHLEAYNKGDNSFQYYPGWFPKTPITPEEYKENVKSEKGFVEGSVKIFKNWADRQLTQYFESLFNINEDTAALPIKYLGSPKVDDQKLYSIKLDQVFEKFVDAMEHKIHMDDVYATGRALQMLLAEDNDLTGKSTFFDIESKKVVQKYSNLIETFRERLEFEVKDVPIQKTKWLDKEIIVGNKKIDIDKSLLIASRYATASVMWLKPIQGAGNLLMGNIVKHKEALKYSLGKRIISNLEAKNIDFTYKDLLWADKEIGSLLSDSMMGDKIYSNKLFLLAEEFGYLADNYRFGSNVRTFKSDTNKIFTEDNMYIFHTIGEKYLSYTTLAAQLKHYTVNVNGKEVPIYDLYKTEPLEPGSKFHKLVWIGPKRIVKDGNIFKEVEGITADEMYRFKAVSARMQGDYRREEHIRVEHYALGKITTVLKKFFPRLILNGAIGKTQSRALGWYNEIETVNDQGEKIKALVWQAREIEGKWRTIGNLIFGMVGLNKDVRDAGGFGNYLAKLTPEQKLNLIDFLITAVMVGLAYAGYALAFGDADDDDTLKKAYKTYLIDNTSQQYNIFDLLRTTVTIAQPVLVKKAFDLATSGTQLFVINTANIATGNAEDIYTKDGNIRGLNLFLKSVPYTAFGRDFYNKVTNMNVDQYNLFGFQEEKLRN